ncbi:MAG: ABC transporter ATP-binding protein [Marinilabiliaceae bacterium]|nr:ABC transporter ATP-binding protein [Marinilabiliaceae bacterium]
MIQINNLTKLFGDKEAVNIPSLHINRGEAVGLVGNNGAGKTTLFRLILDLYKANTGGVLNHGENVAKGEEWKAFTAAYIDGSFLIDFLTPEEYFNFYGETRGIDRDEVKLRLTRFEKFMNGEILGQKKYIRNFSSGNKQKIGIIATLIAEPEIIILDEPFNFLDPSSQIEIKRILKEYNNEKGTTLLVSSHNLDHIVDVSSRILLMEKGHIINDVRNENGEAAEVLNDYFGGK